MNDLLPRITRTALAFLLLSAFGLAAPAQGQTPFTVDDTGDAGDSNLGDGTCSTAGGQCTLRAAIEEANATTGADEIAFAITGQVIQPGSALPPVTESVAFRPSFTGVPDVRIDGTNAGAGTDGLTIQAVSQINGLALTNFDGDGLVLDSGSENSRVNRCFLGAFPDGSDGGNTGNGLTILTSNNDIGGEGTTGDGNIMAYNGRHGIEGNRSVGVDGASTNVMVENVIARNGLDGIFLDNVARNNVGGAITSARNFIGENGGHGIRITGNSATNNTINGNTIGAGDVPVIGTISGNGATGVLFVGQANSNIIGTSVAGEPGNVISGNTTDGVRIEGVDTRANTITGNFIGTNDTGDAAVPNGRDGIRIDGAEGNTIGTTLDIPNVVSGNNENGINITGENLVVKGNIIGLSADETTVLGNGGEGLFLQAGSAGTTVGNTNSNEGNIIAGNGANGMRIGASNVIVEGNFVGIDRSDNDVGNTLAGIRIENGATGVRVGGTLANAANVISGNAGAGILITDMGGQGTASNEVVGNFIGTNAAGDALVGNGADGVAIAGGSGSNTIGGDAADAGNVIAGNEDEVSIAGDNNVVQGNFIGTNANGNDLGSSFNAINIVSGTGNQIGGTTSGAGNVIDFTATNSVVVGGSANVVQGNAIGTNTTAGAGDGVRLLGSDHTVGGTGPGEGNVITNQGRGVGVDSGTGHTIRGNETFDNSILGIDLNRDNRTANDAGDTDDGPNRLQNFPTLQGGGVESNGDVTVTYAVDSDPSATGSGASAYPLTVDFYRVSDGVYLGTDTYAAADYPSGKTTTFTPPVTVAPTDDVVATATDANGNTSEFAGMPQPLPVELASFTATAEASAVRLAWQTASETANAGFDVLQRDPGPGGTPSGAFRPVGTVEGAGTTTEAQRYSFAATNLAPGTYAFRLRQRDLDGTTTLTEPVTVTVAPEGLSLTRPAPHPVRAGQAAQASLSTDVARQVRVVLYDALGRRVATVFEGAVRPGTPETVQIATSGLASGVYFYRTEGADAPRVTRRLTVVR